MEGSTKLSRQQVQVEGLRVYYQVVGQGEPVILVHGLSGSTHWWSRNVRSLARTHRVYLVDLPGFGSMRRARHQFVLQQAASWLLKWMEAVGVERASLIGHSMGGYICIRLAASRPEVVARLVLVSPAVLPQVHTVSGYVMPLLLGIKYMSPRFSLILLYDALRAGPMTLLRAARDLLVQDVRDDIAHINVPTLLVWGDGDTLVPLSLGYILRQEIADARLLILQKAGHVSMFDRPKEFNEAVNAFLASKTVGDQR